MGYYRGKVKVLKQPKPCVQAITFHPSHNPNSIPIITASNPHPNPAPNPHPACIQPAYCYPTRTTILQRLTEPQPARLYARTGPPFGGR